MILNFFFIQQKTTMGEKSEAYHNFMANYRLHSDTGLSSGDIGVVVAYFIVIIIVGVFVSDRMSMCCLTSVSIRAPSRLQQLNVGQYFEIARYNYD